MSNVASLENSKRLYEVSGQLWDGTWLVHAEWKNGEYFVTDIEQAIASGYDDRTPAYDAGYLLRKLPSTIRSNEYPGKFAELWLRRSQPDVYHAWYFVNGIPNCVSDFGVHSSTPEDALCLLAIKLFEEGILTKEQK